MKKKLIISILALFLMTACQTRTSAKSEVVFISEDALLVNKEFSPCSLIATVKDAPINIDMIVEDKVVLNDSTLNCNVEKTDIKLGKTTFVFDYKGVKLEKTITLYDDVPPTIEIDDIFEVEVGNIYFSLIQNVVLTDNFTKSDFIFLGQTGIYDISVIGEYIIVFNAIDEAGNESKKQVIINVVEKEKEIVYVDNGNNNGGNNNNNNNNGGNNNNNNNGGNNNNNNNSGGNNPQPFVTCSNIEVNQGISESDLISRLSNISAGGGNVVVDHTAVNLTIPGTYPVRYLIDGNVLATCTCKVKE